ncbi:DUF460 domain-containing protein [Halosegnis sp.]|uniref:DUF460 domain-containing protein n=1 Tax=Halosegnis sp. TaxID=2864959 RepID=UPI0035D4D4EF
MSTRTTALDALVFGVDVQSGDVRGDAPSYAVVAFDGERVDRDVVSHRKLRRLIDREEPDILATDNVYELAEDKDALVRFLEELPAATTLVQVTGAEQPEPLSRVARRHGVPYGKKPMKEAEAAARLAAANVGQEVSAFADTTRVKVSRGRSTGSGGWSQDRYTRRIHGNVRKRAREVEAQLEAAGLTFEQEATEKYGGYSQAVFTVEAPPTDIPVSAERSGDVRVEIDRERHDGIEFSPLVHRRDHVLVGIDPGTTTAVALVDLDGTPLDVYSTRTDDTAAVTEWIIERGRPLLVAADVEPMPETVEQFRRSFDAAGWVPPTDLPVDEKKHRTRETTYDNDHERDALAAALSAFDAHADQFERIARKIPPQFDRGEVTAAVLREEESVETVLDRMVVDDGDDEEETEPQARELTAEEKEIRRLRERVDRLESHVSDLEATVEEKDAEIEEYEAELSAARREERREARERREVTRLRRENERLEAELADQREETEAVEAKLAELKRLWKLDHSNFADVAGGETDLVPVKPVEQFTTNAIEAADEAFGLAEGDVVLLRDASGAGRSSAERLAAVEPRVILKDGTLPEQAREVLHEHEVPYGPSEDVTIREIDELAVAEEAAIEAVVADWKERAAEREQERTESMVDELISEHRAERKKEQRGD